MKKILATIVLFFAPSTACGQTFNVTDIAYGISHHPSSIAIGDLDGDTDLDIAVCGGSPAGAVTIYLNDGNGVYIEALVLDAFFDPQSIAIADIDGDADQDLITFGNSKILIFRNMGNGTFADFESIQNGVGYGLAVGDLDGDQDIDVATTTIGDFFEPGHVTVRLNHGDGTFGPPMDYQVGNVPFGVKLADVDGDAALDMVVWNSDFDGMLNVLGNTIWILTNNGDGTFTGQPEFMTGGLFSAVLSIGDLDGDSALDLVTANFESDDLSFIMGNGDGTFETPVLVPFDSAVPQEIAFADLDADTDLDMVIACSDNDTVSFWENDGGGKFNLDSSMIFGDIPVSLSAADFDGDGKDNLAVGFAGSGEVVTLFIECSSFLLGDTNGDNRVDLMDVGPFVDMIVEGAFQPEADINMDGLVNLGDVTPFVNLLNNS